MIYRMLKKGCAARILRAIEILNELTMHSLDCMLCWSISDQSSSHRLARLEVLTPLMRL